VEEDIVVRLSRPGGSVADDPLLVVLREGARRMLMHAVEAEVEDFIAACAALVDDHGRRRVVRNGHAPERKLQTGIGPIPVRRPKVRDRGPDRATRLRFTSAVLPAYLRRTKNVEELLPWLYLKGISTGQFEEALAALLGADAPGLSATTVRRLTAAWQDEHERWQARDLSARRYVYLWADGVYFAPRLEHDRQCILVLIGADAQGRKELLAIEDGFRESAQSWRELLLRLRDQNGLVLDPELATGDGALGFWRALHEIWPKTRQQRSRRRLLTPGPSDMDRPACWRPMGPQDRQRAQPTAAIVAGQGQAGPARDLRGREPCCRREGLRSFRSQVPGQASQGGELPEQGPGCLADLLRLTRRALEACSDDEPDRKYLRHHSAQNRQDEGMPVAQDGARHGLQARQIG
jgi:hypothetical protein